jgi:hypothetical protein
MLISSYINSRHQRKVFKDSEASQNESVSNIADNTLETNRTPRSPERYQPSIGLKPKFTLSMEV